MADGPALNLTVSTLTFSPKVFWKSPLFSPITACEWVIFGKYPILSVFWEFAAVCAPATEIGAEIKVAAVIIITIATERDLLLCWWSLEPLKSDSLNFWFIAYQCHKVIYYSFSMCNFSWNYVI